MKGRDRTDLRRLLRVARSWVEIDTDTIEAGETNPSTQRIDDPELRREVKARRRWLSQVEAALR